MVRSGQFSDVVQKIALSLPVVVVVASYAADRSKEGSVAYAAKTLGVTRMQPTAHEQQIARKIVEMQIGLQFDQKDFIEFLKDTRWYKGRLWQANLEITRLRMSLALGLPEGATTIQMYKALNDAQRRDDREMRTRVINVFDPSANHLRPGTEQARYWKVMWSAARPIWGFAAKAPTAPIIRPAVPVLADMPLHSR